MGTLPGKRLQPAAMLPWLALVAALLLNEAALAADSPWLTGDQLRSALAQNVSVVWSNIPLRRALEGLSQTQKVALVLDRRVDPDQKIELACDHVTLAEALQQIATRLGLGETMLGPVAYFGPESTTGRLRTVAALRRQDAKKLPTTVRTKWLEPHPWKWDDAVAPRDLLAALGQELGVRIEGIEQVPADLWAHADLPPLTLPERLMLILAQFDLTYEPASDGLSIRLIPAPEKPFLERHYTVGSDPQAAAAKLKELKLSADAEISVDGGKLLVHGRDEDQEAIEQLLSGTPAQHAPATKEGRKVYTLQVELPVDKLLESLGPRMGLEISIDRKAIAAAGISLEQKVKLDVKEVSADELLRAVLDPVGLTFTKKDTLVEVAPKR